ncbi:hypothetical protein FBZ89_13627 [Nitrospirillum amazonense]|uniref:Uncharacterized protein n=1 Tax=Nitrospirillum amazonense TaxID=28077 RepID=A0A560EL38_9PROT|nr:hypothetical protein FBZ89_13627 [Nitrospirillum amazonense]
MLPIGRRNDQYRDGHFSQNLMTDGALRHPAEPRQVPMPKHDRIASENGSYFQNLLRRFSLND